MRGPACAAYRVATRSLLRHSGPVNSPRTHPVPDFVPGLELSRILYEEAVRPVLDSAYPGLPYAAARVGSGSEVLGFDTARSADHEWGRG